MEDKSDQILSAISTLQQTVSTLQSEFSDFKIETRERFDSLEERLGSVEERLGSVEKRLGSVEVELGSLRENVNKRFVRLFKKLALLETNVVAIGSELTAEIKNEARSLRIEFKRLQSDGFKHQADLLALEERVEKLEKMAA